uniref:Uncharacterized protein n=1 Tax=Biomphalaria glabrata TaxID=6526 RepID=A0A2C9LR12_BIOGL
MSKFSKPRLGTNKPEKTDGIHPSVLKQARRSGVLNLSQRGLTIVPEEVWSVQEYVPEEAKSVSMDNTEDKWWDVVDLTKLILASNHLTTMGEGLRNFQALTVLDVKENYFFLCLLWCCQNRLSAVCCSGITDLAALKINEP